ncbi:Uma2 family endonuclease [Cryptosporangium sp. NPDC048952]|uniref:Uma2 family endonuclease n=1 Tax=Cryptosporangium sp. NPDC048952 TaxID=3363961 RepID=UPI003715D947
MNADPFDYSIPWPPGGEWTNAFLDALRDDVPYRTEIVDGNLVVSPKPHPWHLLVSRRIANALEDAAPPGITAYEELEIRWNDGERVRRSLAPDVAVAPFDLVDGEEPFARPAAVQLVVEIVSPSSVVTDREHKPRLYAAWGLPRMWVLDRSQGLTEYQLTQSGGPEVVQVLSSGRFSTDVPFPVVIDLDRLG